MWVIVPDQNISLMTKRGKGRGKGSRITSSNKSNEGTIRNRKQILFFSVLTLTDDNAKRKTVDRQRKPGWVSAQRSASFTAMRYRVRGCVVALLM